MDFEEALVALLDGKKIRKSNDNAWYTKDTVLEYSFVELHEEFFLYTDWIISDAR